ncbi:MAG: carbohydrate ABC transporter permease [Spirochaetia bacterium]
MNAYKSMTREDKQRNNKIRRTAGRVLVYGLVFIVLVIILIPYGWMISGSFKTRLEIQSSDVTREGQEPSWIPRNPTLQNYALVNETVPMFRYLVNSLITASLTMVAATFVSMFAAYAISRFRFKWKQKYRLLLYSTQMFPGIAFLIPYFMIFTLISRYLHIPMKDTFHGMVLTYTTFALPFCVLLLSSFLEGIPKEIDEQAEIDGCSRFQTVIRIIFPISLPGITSAGIFAFIMAWNEMLFATVLTGNDVRPVSLGLMEYITQQQARWGGMMAACIIVSVPVLVFFTFLQRQIVEGMVQGSTKG